MVEDGRTGGLLNYRPLGAAFFLAYFSIVPGWIGDYFEIPPHDYRSLTFTILILVLLVSVEALNLLFIARKE
jgi:hypothetical protein